MTAPEPGTLVMVKCVPGATRDEVVGLLGDRLKVRVAAPPEGGKANEAVRSLIAGLLGVAANRVSIERGATTPLKTLRVHGLSAADAQTRLVKAGVLKPGESVRSEKSANSTGSETPALPIAPAPAARSGRQR